MILIALGIAVVLYSALGALALWNLPKE